ncbi:MAG: acetylglutamate kinase [Acidobacteria bacterium]|nr:MAG: acetylglutamate kinase [Acidobacteriota bacterium]
MSLVETRRKASTLAEALPYIKAYSGKIVVIKYGGHAMTEPGLRESFAQDVALMRLVGIFPVVVHGGGPQISAAMSEAGKAPEFIDGYRVTDLETAEIVRTVLVGQVNPSIVGLINTHGDLACGVSGEDANLIRATRKTGPDGQDIGYVGEVAEVRVGILHNLIEDGFVPVVAPVARCDDGQLHNVNADAAAGAIAESLGAEKLIYLTDVEGLYEDLGDEDSLISALGASELREMLDSGKLSAGMLPKIASCDRALSNGVDRAHILDGRIEHALLLEVFTPEGIGTMVTATGGLSEIEAREAAAGHGRRGPSNGNLGDAS